MNSVNDQAVVAEEQSGLLVTSLRSLEQTLQTYTRELKKLARIQSSKPNVKVHHSIDQHLNQDEKASVYIRTVFLKVGEIDTIKENFAADVFIQAKWKEPLLDGIPAENIDDIDWGTLWSPRLYMENVIGEPKESIWHAVTFDNEGQAVVCQKRRVKGNFMEKMELKEFPFDSQVAFGRRGTILYSRPRNDYSDWTYNFTNMDLTVTVASELLEENVDLQEDTSEFSTINCQSFVDEQEWRLHSHVKVNKRTLTSEFDSIRRKPVLSSSCIAQRRPGFFIWNILLVMLFICSLSFATFSVSIAKPQNRLQLSFTLVLTNIAFKFVANQSLPKISYLTYLDKYILTSMCTLCAICVWHAIIPVIMVSGLSGSSNTSLLSSSLITVDINNLHEDDLKLAMEWDKYALMIIGLFYLIFHIVFFTVIFVKGARRRSRFAEEDVRHQERMIGVQSEKQPAVMKSPSLTSCSSKSKVDPLL